MNSDVKAKWVKALRSGEYKQGFRALRSDGCFCVMGVLCELFVREIAEATWLVDGDGDEIIITPNGDTGRGVAPAEVREWAGFPIHDINGRIMTLNDDGLSFEELADYIEAEL